MRAYTDSKRTGSTACGYCRQTGHNIGDCPNIQFDYDEWSAYRVPINSPTLKFCHWYKGDYSYWMKAIYKYYPKFVAAQERKLRPATARPRTAPKCGFCRSPDHNRRNCPEMVAIAANLKQANQNWRQALYSRLVTDLGLGVGAAVKVQQKNSYYNRDKGVKEFIGIITKMDLSKCNLFASRTDVGYDYTITPVITAMFNGQEMQLNLGDRNKPLRSLCGKDLLVNGNSYYGHVEFVETIGRCETPLDEEWVKEGLKDEFEWLLKKRTQETLEDAKILRAIDYWKVA